jgi:uncharacterized protein YcbX
METSSYSNKLIVSELFIYPLKSGHEVGLKQSFLNPFGLENDRVLMLINKKSKACLNIRTHPKIYEIRVSIDGNIFSLNVPEKGEFKINFDFPEEKNNMIKMDLWDIPVDVSTFPDGEQVSKILSEYFSEDVILVKPLSTRKLKDFERSDFYTQEFQDSDATYFADLAPLLVTSEESFNHVAGIVKKKTGEDLQPLNFRPNIILKGGKEEFWEDKVNKLRIGNVVLRRVKGCVRCKLTTYDLNSKKFRKSKEPLEVLNDIHFDEQLEGVIFGQNFCVDLIEGKKANIKVGDEVEVLN